MAGKQTLHRLLANSSHICPCTQLLPAMSTSLLRHHHVFKDGGDAGSRNTVHDPPLWHPLLRTVMITSMPSHHYVSHHHVIKDVSRAVSHHLTDGWPPPPTPATAYTSHNHVITPSVTRHQSWKGSRQLYRLLTTFLTPILVKGHDHIIQLTAVGTS